MENHPDKLFEMERVSGPATRFNAGDAVGYTVDTCRELGFPIAPQIRARIGAAAKALLESEFPPDIVVAACVQAVRNCWFGSVETIAQEMVVAASGAKTTRAEYAMVLAEVSQRMKTEGSRVWEVARSENERKKRAQERGLEA